MGIELVKIAVLRHAAHLSGRAFKVLMVMALMALDRPNLKGQPARLYFGGEGPLAHALYGDPVGEDYTANQYREVRTVVKELRDARLIEATIDRPSKRSGRAQCYRVALDLVANAGEIAPSNPGDCPPQSDANAGEIAAQTRGIIPTPRTDTGLISEDLSQGSISHSPASTTDRRGIGAVEMNGVNVRPGQPHAYRPDEYDDECLDCGAKRLNTVHRRTA